MIWPRWMTSPAFAGTKFSGLSGMGMNPSKPVPTMLDCGNRYWGTELSAEQELECTVQERNMSLRSIMSSPTMT